MKAPFHFLDDGVKGKIMESVSKVCVGPVTAMAGLQREARSIHVMKDLSSMEERLKRGSVFAYFDD